MAELLERIASLLRRSNGLVQERNEVHVQFDVHADATEFFDTMVEAGEPAVDAAVEDFTSEG